MIDDGDVGVRGSGVLFRIEGSLGWGIVREFYAAVGTPDDFSSLVYMISRSRSTRRTV